MLHKGDGDMAQKLRALTVLVEDYRSVSSNHIRQLTITFNSRGSEYLCVCVTIPGPK